MLSEQNPSPPIYPDPDTDTLRAWVDIDLESVRRNANALMLHARAPLIAMIKADAYGLGMIPVARALGAAFGDPDATDVLTPALWGVGVAALDEAATLRAAGCTANILCTTPLALSEFEDAHRLGVRPSLHRSADIERWCAFGGGAWHLAIDTGMARAGVRWDEVSPLRAAVAQHPPEGVFTHFHSAELANNSRDVQDRRFAEALSVLRDALPTDLLTHTDNSAAIARRGESQCSLVRPGIGLYGAAQLSELPLRQTVHLRARVVDVRDVLDGETVSYDATYTANGTRRIATLAIGYADGYRRSYSNRGLALVHGTRVPVVGNVTMDMTMIDVTALEERCQVGDVATLIGEGSHGRLTTDEVAALVDMSPYELLVGLRLRARRRYHRSTATALIAGPADFTL